MNALLERLRAIPLRAAVDTAVVVVLAGIGLAGLATAFDDRGYLLAGFGGLLVGVAVALASALLRLGVLLTGALALAAYYLLGTAFAVPEQGIGLVVPSPLSLASLTIGPVLGWADIVTLRAPASLPQYIAAVPYVTGWLVGLVGALLAIRWLPTRRRTVWRASLLLIGPAAVYLASILLGTQQPYHPGVRGVAFAAISLVWLGWRRSARAQVGGNAAMLRRKLVGTAILVVAAMAVGTAAGAVLAPAPTQRFVLRDEIQPPFDPATYSSPLAGFRKYTKDLTDDTLFTVDGLQPNETIRLATMDAYDGVLWNVADPQQATDASGSFRLVGRNIPAPPLVTPGQTTKLTFTIDGYRDVWLPSAGYPVSTAYTAGPIRNQTDDVRYNPSTGISVVTSGVRAGDAYTVDAELQATPKEGQLDSTPVASLQLPNARIIPDVVAAKAKEFAKDAKSPYEQLSQIAITLKSTGYFSHGTGSGSAPSRAGHGADRMVDMFDGTVMVGDQEQYASAFALMARSLGYPARVVMGFAPEVTPGRPTAVTGDDVTAWVEVPFEGYGWVPFFPTPDRTDVPQDQIPRPQSEPQPQVRQPPPTQTDRDDLITAVEIKDGDRKRDGIFGIPAWVFGVGISVLVLLLIVFGPWLAVALVKRRRRRRRSAGSGDARAAGAWDELLDRYAELGYRVPVEGTRRMRAAGLSEQVPNSGAPLATLAARTDGAVFSGRDVPDDEVDAVWTEAEASVALAAAAAGRARRLLARYRLSSFSRLTNRVVRAAGVAADRRRRP